MALKLITINIPQLYYDCVDNLVAAGEFENRSIAIRTMLDLFFDKEEQFNAQILDETKQLRENVK